MIKLEGFLSRRWRWVLGVWIAILVAALPFAVRQTEHLTGGGFDVPGSESHAVSDALETDYASRTQGIAALLEADPGSTSSERDAAVDRLSEAVAGIDHISLSSGAEAAALAELEREGVAIVPISSDLPPDEITDSAVDLREELSTGTSENGVTTYLVGQPAAWAGLQELSKEDLAKAEAIGFPIVMLILLVVFGSLAAAVLPLALAIFSVIVTGALIYALSLQMEMSVFVTNMASMIGIGVAVDYSLFILARFREEVRAGSSAAEARATALATSGLAVAFSGAAVVISLAGLWMVDNQAMRSMALGAMIVVGVSILTAVTLLPVLIRVLGHRVEAGGVAWRVIGFFRSLRDRRRRSGSTTPDKAGFWERWTERVMARPWLSVALVSAVMLTLAIPTLSMETGNGAIEQFPRDYDVRVGFEKAAALTGGGSDPIQIVAEFDRGGPSDPANAAAVAELRRDLSRDPEVLRVDPPLAASNSVLIEANLRVSGESEEAFNLVDRLRETILPGSVLEQRATLSAGGEPARMHDVQNQISGAMWRIIVFILAFSYLVLMVMLRSVLLPLKAILMNLLSIGAAYGVLVVVFQWGWFDGFLGFESLGAIDTINPPLILAVVFGLSMDYEVFLLSRIRERYMEHGDNKRAVAEGLSSSARTISSAALIMTAVFLVFVMTGVPSIQQIGLGNAVAIALDATLVRLILVPAAMQLIGRWNWWMPGWLDRILPHIELEGRRPQQPRAAEA